MSYRKNEGFKAVRIDEVDPGQTFVFNGYLWVYMSMAIRNSGRAVCYAMRCVDSKVRVFTRGTEVFI